MQAPNYLLSDIWYTTVVNTCESCEHDMLEYAWQLVSPFRPSSAPRFISWWRIISLPWTRESVFSHRSSYTEAPVSITGDTTSLCDHLSSSFFTLLSHHLCSSLSLPTLPSCQSTPINHPLPIPSLSITVSPSNPPSSTHISSLCSLL